LHCCGGCRDNTLASQQEEETEKGEIQTSHATRASSLATARSTATSIHLLMGLHHSLLINVLVREVLLLST
jgi:hypothetical protein